MNSRRWIAGALLIALMVGGALWWSQRETAAAPQYRTVAVERGRIVAGVASSGTVNPVRQVQVGTQVSGQIVELLADFNTEVKKGQLIARIDPENFDNKVRQSRADLDAAKASVLTAQATVAAALAAVSKAQLDFDNAQRDSSRKKDLLAREFISQADFETTRNTAGTLGESLKATKAQVDVARAQVQSADATVQQREASLAQSLVDRERTQVRSPVDGVVIKRSVDVGQTVAASLQAPELFIIARDLNDMQVEVSIDEADIGRLKIGQAATFLVDAFPGRVYEGRVSQVRKAAVSLQNVITYTVVVAFSNEGGHLLPGMTANARIVTDQRDAVLKVPNAALRMKIAGVAEPVAAPAGLSVNASEAAPKSASGAVASGGRGSTSGRVYVLGRDGDPVAVPIRLGVTDGTLTEVVAGELEEGAMVVVGQVAPGAPARSGGPRLSF